jgi:hypothetical protein
MNAFFNDLGRQVLAQWKKVNFSLEKFPAIARKALEARLPSKHVALPELMREYLLNDEQPLQSMSGFGQPELIAYEHPRFYIQLLFWLDGTTDIHQHEFSGAFHVMHGSSIHAHYTFENARSVTPHLRLGDVRMKQIELLETGRTVPIVSGQSCIHSLFHLDSPSVTVVLRTHNDPGTGPQFNYLPPHLAVDPMHADTLTMRRKQLLDVLEQGDDPAYAGLVKEMLGTLDFERGFFILQHSMAALRDRGEWHAALKLFRQRHGQLAAGVQATLEEGVRRDLIKNMRSTIAAPEHRFFLALLMNAPTRADLLTLVKRRYPKPAPVETVMRWAQELAILTEDGVELLDAAFPATLDAELEDQPEIFLSALRYFLSGSKRLPPALRGQPPAVIQELHQAFAASTLGMLVV